MERGMDEELEGGTWVPTLLALGGLAYVVAGALWMDAHGTGPESTLTLTSIVELLWAVFSWPLDLVGVI